MRADLSATAELDDQESTVTQFVLLGNLEDQPSGMVVSAVQ
jgi:hypothetical protein